MSLRLSCILAALCGILGVVLLGLYFFPPSPLPTGGATAGQLTAFATRYGSFLFLGAWLQAVGTALAVVFFLALVHLAGAATKLAGRIATLASGVLLAVVLVEGAFTMTVAQAAAHGHTMTAVVCWDINGIFIHVIPIVPAPVVYLALGVVLLGSRLISRAFGYAALALGIAFAVAGFAGLFNAAALTVVIIFLAAQELWIVAAAIALIVRAGRPRGALSDPAL